LVIVFEKSVVST